MKISVPQNFSPVCSPQLKLASPYRDSRDVGAKQHPVSADEIPGQKQPSVSVAEIPGQKQRSVDTAEFPGQKYHSVNT